MEFMPVVMEALKVTPIALFLFFCLYVVWKYVHKKDADLTAERAMTLAIQKEFFEKMMSSNGQISAAYNALANAIQRMNDVNEDNTRLILSRIDDLDPRKAGLRPLNPRKPVAKPTEPAQA
ncbi:hypothetical protein [Spirosoma sordidisoli]|uniref:Uncharacterized protein n=1 Tax=Spirosoma sordidisoli TaxID=2502893 RepID=A0A4Q2UJY4_9BACT|nr:hypothetical protein [Spirosoma sordidisoli]RYC69817.1 hypothetical protein EQG79_14585 [Spirosoma sordidisoli]